MQLRLIVRGSAQRPEFATDHGFRYHKGIPAQHVDVFGYEWRQPYHIFIPHGIAFRARTAGNMMSPTHAPGYGVRCYPVRIVDGKILVALG